MRWRMEWPAVLLAGDAGRYFDAMTATSLWLLQKRPLRDQPFATIGEIVGLDCGRGY